MGLEGAHHTIALAEVNLTEVLDVVVVGLCEAVGLRFVLKRFEVLALELPTLGSVGRARTRLLLVGGEELLLARDRVVALAVEHLVAHQARRSKLSVAPSVHEGAHHSRSPAVALPLLLRRRAEALLEPRRANALVVYRRVTLASFTLGFDPLVARGLVGCGAWLRGLETVQVAL